MSSAAPTLTCKQCNYANEPERVYCHNCGAKLDRSLLPKEPAKVTEDSQEKARRRVRKLVNPARGFFTNWHKAFFNALAAAVTIAALVQMARPPAGIPPVPSKDDLLGAPPLVQDFADLQMQTTPQARMLSESMINLYLASAIRPKSENAGDYFKFDRAFVNAAPDVIKITAQESAFGYPIYASTSYKLAIAGGKLVATNVGGALGRLPIHPMVMAYCGSFFQSLWDALQRERSALDSMQSVTVTKDGVAVVSKPHP